LFTISRHEEKDRVFGTEFVNEIQQKYMVFGMTSVWEFGIGSDNSFFKDNRKIVLEIGMTMSGSS
jgi:hypothetical protein